MDEKNMEQQLENYWKESKETIPSLKDISENVYVRMSDMTVGHLISSCAGFVMLFVILPMFYGDYFAMAKMAHREPGLAKLLGNTSPGGMTIGLLSCAFFMGGIALYHSLRWSRTLLYYLFTFLGLIMLFEIRYHLRQSGFIMPDKQGIWNLIFMVLAFVILLGIIYLIYKKHKIILLRIMTVVNLILTMINCSMILLFFSKIESEMPDRHVYYLSLFFCAVILFQSCAAVKTFAPLLQIKSFWKTRV